MERKINAPDQETLSDTEAATWLGIKEGMFRAIAQRLRLPGVPFGPRTLRWHWMDLVSILHLLSRGAFQGEDASSKSENDEES